MKEFVHQVNQADIIYDIVKKTDLQMFDLLSEQLDNTVYVKREDLQDVHSFKIRGAHHKIKRLSVKEKACGIIASSAGNHAQGVALSAKNEGINALIVMPTTTPDIKVNAVKHYGASVVQFGDTYDDAYEHAQKLAQSEGRIFIHPYDDMDVIIGQATIGKEIIEQSPYIPDIVFIAVGGGGLISGIGAYLKEVSPTTQIIGVEPDNAASMTEALKHNTRVTLDHVGIFADGVAVKQVGHYTFDIAKRVVDDMITVSTDEICAAIKDIFDETRSIAEPAGALAIAGMKAYVKRHHIQKKHLVAINCGANINFDRLRHIAERAELGEANEAIFAVTIPETPGSFKTFCQRIGKRNITEFNYRYSDNEHAHIFVGITLKNGKEERVSIADNLKQYYPIVDLTDDECSKIHLRHMVGGRSKRVENERLYRFQFPERPGALLSFLEHLNSHWNISLFHYRNHGAAFGRVLIGVQVPPKNLEEFKKSIEAIGYHAIDESKNPARSLFL